jgi:hypothetical protein
MSTSTRLEAFQSQVTDPPAPPRREPAADPLVLGLPLIAVGAFALGLQLVGFVSVSSDGSPLAVLIAASGLGLLLSTAWAASLRATPISSTPATCSSRPHHARAVAANTRSDGQSPDKHTPRGPPGEGIRVERKRPNGCSRVACISIGGSIDNPACSRPQIQIRLR